MRKLVVFAKEPVAGKVKTRLCPPLTFELAAACHRAFVRDTLERIAGYVDAELILAAVPDDAAPWLASAAAAVGARVVPQGPGDLGARLGRVFAREGADADLVVVGSDSPNLPLAYVDQAFDHLAEGRLVLGPSMDGGYYLVGAASSVPRIFDLGTSWGSARVLRQTLWLAREQDLDVALLPSWYDVDDVEGLRALMRALQEPVGGRSALPHCRRILTEIIRAGVKL